MGDHEDIKDLKEEVEELKYGRRASDREQPKSGFKFDLNFAILIVPVIGYVWAFYQQQQDNKIAIDNLKVEFQHKLEMQEAQYTAKFDNIFTNIAQAKSSADKASMSLETTNKQVDNNRDDIRTNHTYITSKIVDLAGRITKVEKKVEVSH